MHIRNFLENYNPLGFEYATVRISSHIKFLRLSEYLYRIYICGNSEDLSCKIQYEHALAQNAISQQKALLQQRNREEDINYIQAIYQCMNAKDKYIYICTSSLEYKPSANACLYENGEIFITSSALTNSLSKYLGMSVKLKDVINELKNYGVLDTDSSSANSKKKKGIRHYVIYFNFLEQACQIIRKYSDDI